MAQSAGTARPSAERAANTGRVLAALVGRGPMTQAGLRDLTGLSRPTLGAILGELAADGWVRQDPPRLDRAGTAGRPARPVRIAPDVIAVAGVDVGVHSVRVVVADAVGRARHVAARAVPPGLAGPERAAHARSVIAEVVGAAGREMGEIAALGVGVSGIVDAEGRIRRSTVVPEWSGFHIGRDLGRWAGCAVGVVNDVNLAAVGEHWAGAARMCEDVVYLHLGRRTSAALLIDGRIHSGRTGAAGEIGSIPALFFDTPTVLLGPGASQDDPGIPDVFARAAAGDAAARDRTEDFARLVAASVETLSRILDPEVVVLGGGLARAGDALLTAVRRHVSVVDDVAPPLVLGELADEAVALGGVRRALELAARAEPRLRPLLAAGAVRPEPEPRSASGTRPAPSGLETPGRTA